LFKAIRVELVSALGDDAYGDMLISTSSTTHVSMKHTVRVSSHATAIYSATLDTDGELVVAVADMDVFAAVTPQYVMGDSITTLISNAEIVVVDGNFPVDTIRAICVSAHRHQVPIWFEPTSVAKCTKILKADTLNMLTYISPNRGEMIALLKDFAGSEVVAGINLTSIRQDDIDGHIQLVQYFQLHSKIPAVIMKMGASGVIVGAEDKVLHYPALPLTRSPVSVSGAGDSLAAGTIWSIVSQPTTSLNIRPTSVHTAVKFGLAAAKMSLESTATINPLLCASSLDQILLDTKVEL